MTPREWFLMSVPAVVALAGGVMAALWHPTARARSLVQHFAAGVVLAALAVELLPEIGREHAPGLVLATFIDVATDGFIIGAGFAAGGETGPVLAIGLSVELLFLGLALTTEAPGGLRIVLLSGGIGLTVLACAAIGKLLLTGASKAVIGGALALAAAALLYLVTEELLMEAHSGKEPETPASTLVLFGGFLAFWTVQLVGAR